MVATIRVSGTATGVAAVAGSVSNARGGRLNVTVKAIDDPTLAWFAIGPSADPPATYGDWSADWGGLFPPEPADATLKSTVPPNTFDVTLTMPARTDLITTGDTLYVGVFYGATGTPDGATVPDLVAGPVPVIA